MMSQLIKPRIFRATWKKNLPQSFSLWVLQFGRRYEYMTRYFNSWAEALDYLVSGTAEREWRYIQRGGPVGGFKR